MQNKKKKRQDPGPDAMDMTGRYGTYNVQPTADTANTFPAVAQGLPKEKETKKE